MRNINHPGKFDLEGDNETNAETEVLLQIQKSRIIAETKNEQNLKSDLFKSLEELLLEIYNTEISDFLPHTLSVLFYFDESDWNLYLPNLKKIILNSMIELNSQPSIKQNFLRLFGNLTSMQLFIEVIIITLD